MTGVPNEFPLPEDVYERQRSLLGASIASEPQSPRVSRRWMVVAAAAAILVISGTAAALGEFVLDEGFIGLPPEGATPSTPESGELVLHYLGRSVSHDARIIQAWVYADGRIISSGASASSSRAVPGSANQLTGYLEQRLTPEGVELLRSKVAGLLSRNRALLVTLPDDYDPLGGPHPDPTRGRGLTLFVTEPLFPGGWGTVEARDGNRFVGLHWEVWKNGLSQPEGPIATPEQASLVLQLDSILTEPSSVLPANAWAVREFRAYVPSHYQVCMDTPPSKDVSQLLALLPAPAADVLRAKGLKWSAHDLISPVEGVVGRKVNYCAKLTTEEAREVAEPFSGRDHDPQFSEVILGYRLATPADPTNLDATSSIWFEPYFPHGQITCSSCG